MTKFDYVSPFDDDKDDDDKVDLRTAVRGHIDFALRFEEVKVCVVCGEVPRKPVSLYDCPWYGEMTVTLGGAHPVGGLVGICSSCWWGRGPKRQIISKWRKTAPPFIQLLPDVPFQLVARGRCDDAALAKVIRDTLDKVPRPSRRKIMDYVLSDVPYSVTGRGMRFEALGHWPGMSDGCVGTNMDQGHAIRLRASEVKHAGINSLIETIAHELAHTEQKAEELSFKSSDDCERDVEARLRKWGFDTGTTKYQKQLLLAKCDRLIKNARKMKREIKSNARLPSGNFAIAALSAMERAQNAMFNSYERWHGR